MERFYCKTRIVSGPGAVSALAELGAKRLFLVTDPFFQENGAAARVSAAAKAEAVQVFHRASSGPSAELAAEGVGLVRDFRPDVIAALGGGGTIDCAKAISYFSQCGAALAAIPTTSGSGSEVTDRAALTQGRVRHSLADERLRPELAILDSDLLEGLPPRLIADEGFDAVCHCVEAYVAKDAGAITDALAGEAFCTAYANLPASYTGHTEVRLKLHIAAAMAGLSFTQAGLGLCHAMAHSLGGAFHVPHGRLNAILLPAVISINAYAAGAKYARLSRLAGLGGSADTAAVRNLKNALIRLRRELNMPDTLAQAGIAPARVWREAGQLVRAALADPCCRTNPVPVEDFMVRRVLEEVTGRV